MAFFYCLIVDKWKPSVDNLLATRGFWEKLTKGNFARRKVFSPKCVFAKRTPKAPPYRLGFFVSQCQKTLPCIKSPFRTKTKNKNFYKKQLTFVITFVRLKMYLPSHRGKNGKNGSPNIETQNNNN